MIKTFHKDALASEPTRGKTAGLIGASIVFLLGSPSHSVSMADQARQLLQHAVQLTLVFFGLSTPLVQQQIPVRVFPRAPAQHHLAPLAHKRSPVLAVVSTTQTGANSMFLRRVPVQPRMAYVFEGQASYQNKPCPNTRILIRLNSGGRSVAQDTVTGPDGNYSLSMSIAAEDHDLVDWTIEAFIPDLEKVEIVGRRIVELQDGPERTPVVVTSPVEFMVALSI